MALAAAVALLVPILGSERAGAADSAVTIVHGIPGVPVDVYAGGTDPSNEIVADFQPGAVAGPLSVPAGSLPVVVVPAGADPTDPANQVISQTLDVPSGANVSVVANLVGGAPNLLPFANDVSAVDEGSSRVVVRHTADAPAVNVLVDGEVAFANLAPGAEASAVLPAGTYDVQVQLTDGTPLSALSPGSVDIPAGKDVIVYAVGSASDQQYPLGLVQQLLDVPVTPAATPTTMAPVPPAAAGVTASPAMTG
jgi:hypothetical protein